MKRRNWLAVLIGAACLPFVGCKEPDPEPPEIIVPEKEKPAEPDAGDTGMIFRIIPTGNTVSLERVKGLESGYQHFWVVGEVRAVHVVGDHELEIFAGNSKADQI